MHVIYLKDSLEMYTFWCLLSEKQELENIIPTTEESEPKRHRGRKIRKSSTAANISRHNSLDTPVDLFPDSANSSRSSGYHSQQDLFSTAGGDYLITICL